MLRLSVGSQRGPSWFRKAFLMGLMVGEGRELGWGGSWFSSTGAFTCIPSCRLPHKACGADLSRKVCKSVMDRLS